MRIGCDAVSPLIVCEATPFDRCSWTNVPLSLGLGVKGTLMSTLASTVQDALGREPGKLNSTLLVVLGNLNWPDRDLLTVTCRAVGLPFVNADSDDDLCDKIRAADNPVAFVYLRDLALISRLKNDPAFDKVPIMIINTAGKIGLGVIQAAGLNAVFEFESPFSAERTLKALKPYL